jgi:hypothetical protein
MMKPSVQPVSAQCSSNKRDAQQPLQPAIRATGRSFPPETSNHDESASNLQKSGERDASWKEREHYLTIDVGRRGESFISIQPSLYSQ